MATHIYPQWFHRVQKLFFIVAVALLITLPVLYGRHKIDISSTEVIVIFVLFFLLWALFSIGVRLCIPSVVVESTLPIHTHAPEPTVFLHDPASSRTAVPTSSALKSSSISTTAKPLHTIDALEHRLSQEQEEEEYQDIEQLKKKLAQDITFSSSTATAPAATVITTSPPPAVSKTARFAEGEEQIDDDLDRRQPRRQSRQGSDGNIALDQLSSSTPPTSSALRRGYVSTPTSPISSPTTILYPPPLPLPSTSNSSSPRGVSFQTEPLKRSSTDARHVRSNSSSAAVTGVRFQRGLGSPSMGVSEEEDEDSLESSYPTFASYRQAQHAHFDAFAQRMRRTLETAAATNAATAATEVSSPSPLHLQSIPNPTAATLETVHTSDTSTHQQISALPH